LLMMLIEFWDQCYSFMIRNYPTLAHVMLYG